MELRVWAGSTNEARYDNPSNSLKYTHTPADNSLFVEKVYHRFILVLDHRSPHVRQFMRFAIVGVLQNGVNLCVFALAVALSVPYLAASVLAAAVALSVSFFLNLRWTFPGSTGRMSGRAVRFATVWITIVLIGLPILAVLVSVAHLPRILAQAIVIVVGAPISYTAQRLWTFRHEVPHKTHRTAASDSP
jgi:putative flippase GtrA